MNMVQTVYILVDVPNSRVEDKYVVLTEDVDRAREYIVQAWKDKIKPEIGVHMFEISDNGNGIEYAPSERARIY